MLRRWMGVSFVISLTALGCASSSQDTVPDTDEADLSQFPGTVFKTSDGLSIRIEMADGKSPRTKNQRFIRGTATRDGSQYGAWCFMRGANRLKKTTTVSCSVGATTVSHDDDESLTFDVICDEETGHCTLDRRYGGDFSFLDRQARILLGNRSESEKEVHDASLTVVKKGESLSKDPFALASRIHQALAGIVGVRVHIDDLDTDAPSTGYEFRFNNEVNVDFQPAFGNSHSTLNSHLATVPLLESAGDLSSGMTDSATILTRAKAALKK